MSSGARKSTTSSNKTVTERKKRVLPPSPSTSSQGTRERGLRPESSAKDQGSQETEKKTSKEIKGATEMIGWLEKLRKQIENDEYHSEVFTKSPGGGVESGKQLKILKEICEKIGENSKNHRDLLSKVDELCSTLQNVSDDMPAEDTSELSKVKVAMKIEGKAVKQGGCVGKKEQIENAISNAKKLIEKVGARRGTNAIQSKAREKQNLETAQKAEQQGKLRIKVVTEWLNKFENQIVSGMFDVKDFSKPKPKDGNNEDINKCHSQIVDCCKKLKNSNEDRISTDKEVKTLLKEIKDWTDVKTNEKKKGEEIETLLKDSHALLLEKKKDFKGASDELECLRTELEAWDDVKTLEDKVKSKCELTKSVRSTRFFLLEKKKQLKGENDKKENDLKQMRIQEQAIKELLEMICSPKKPSDKDTTKALDKIKEYVSDAQKQLTNVNVNKGNELKEMQKQEKAIKELLAMINSSRKTSDKDTTKALDEIKKYVSDTQKQLNNANEELQCLTKEIETWDDLKDIEDKMQTTCELAELIRWNRLAVVAIKQKKQSGNEESEKARKEKQSQEKAIKDMLAIIKNDPGEVPIDMALDKIKRHIEKQIDDLNRIEKLSHKLEEKGHMILKFSEGKGLKVIEHNTLVDELNSTLEILERCESETKSCVEEIGQLEEVLKIGNNNISISQRCHLAQQKSLEFQQNFVSREKYDRLNLENSRLHDQIKQLETDKNSAYNRLSKVAGARLTDNNPNIADLSDPNRPTKLAEQYSELYDSPWTDAFETLNEHKKEKKCIEFLLGIIVNCYDICGELSKNHQLILKRAVCFPCDDKESTQTSKKTKGEKDNFIPFSAVHSKALSELRKQTADISVDNVKSLIKSDHKEWFDSEELEKYTFLCIELCWLMHVQTPPVVIETSAKSGSKFDTNRYKQYTKAGKTVDYLVWPALLLEENGAILCKGVAQGKK